jgi:HEXXH motif-containing protein
MAGELPTHRISSHDLGRLAVGEPTPEAIRLMRAAEVSKHTLLLEALRRAARQGGGSEAFERATEVLSAVYERAPEVAAEMIGLPHFGLWAADALSRHRGAADWPRGTHRALARLAAFAAASALRIGYPFDLPTPVYRGMVTLPTVGTARVGRPHYSGWARIRLDHNGASVKSALRAVSLPVGNGLQVRKADPAWRPSTVLTASANGVTFRAIFETDDLLLTQLSPHMPADSRPSATRWPERVQAAWQLLASHHRLAAIGIAAAVNTLVPLREPAQGSLISATSGWAWGAIALSLPADIPRLAETLVHEFFHLVLAAIDDMSPLVRGSGDERYYAPWRDDPRPVSGLVQGTYAQLGVAGFWGRQRHVGTLSSRLRGEVEFARARLAAFEGAQTLNEAPTLTTTGRTLTALMRTRLAEWQSETVSAAAETAALEIAAEHRLRWRLSNLRPERSLIDDLARRWLADQPLVPPGPRSHRHPAVRQCAHRMRPDLFRLLQLRYRDPARFIRESSEPGRFGTADVAFACGDYRTASQGYLSRVQSGEDPGAWVGLLLSRSRLAHQPPGFERPEIIAAVYQRLRTLMGLLPDAEALIAWLAIQPETAS